MQDAQQNASEKAPKASIVMATRNKVDLLRRTLASIFKQQPPFDFETIIVDDGSTDDTPAVWREFPAVRYVRLENDRYRNPSVARNAGYRLARGSVVIAQSDEVIHRDDGAIERLTNDIQPGEFLIARVYNYLVDANRCNAIYTAARRPRPFFFLGSLWRRDLYAIGGNDEQFVDPGYDDNFFGDCLLNGLRLNCRYLDEVVGLHQDHPRPENLDQLILSSKRIYEAKRAAIAAGAGEWCASGGPWEFEQ